MKFQLFTLSTFVLFLISCSKDADILVPDPFNPGQSTFQSSLFIEVKNTEGRPVANTLVRIGQVEEETDAEGFLFLKDVHVGESSYLVAEKEGYFHASRRFYPTAGKSQYLSLILLPDTRDAFFASADGAVLPVDGGVTLHFPKDAYIHTNGEVYTGIVVVTAEAISADDQQLSYKMPGDLMGVDAGGEFGRLASMGMITVELRTASGDALKLKPGATAGLHFEVPASMTSSAPSSMPMWHFDEEVGIWREEGMAMLSSGTYIAQVSHFSFWNCDAWFPVVKWGASFVYESGPASQVEVCITIKSLNTMSCDYTNAEGLVTGMVAANELLQLVIKDRCGNEIFSQEIGPYTEEALIGPLSIPYGALISTTITGIAVNCMNAPVIDGYVKFRNNEYSFFTPLDENTGAFHYTIFNCGEGDVVISLVDIAAYKVSLPVTYDSAPLIDAGTIEVCENSLEYVDLEVVGFPDHVIFKFPEISVYEKGTILYVPDSVQLEGFFEIRVEGNSPGTYTPYFASIGIYLPNGEQVYSEGGDLSITFTDFGEKGTYITGTITGTLNPPQGPSGGSSYPLLGKFSVLRE